MDFKKTKAVLMKGALFAAAGVGFAGAAGAAINMTASFQPIIDIIGVITSNSDSWIGLIVLGVEITIAMAVGYFVKGIMSRATGHGK